MRRIGVGIGAGYDVIVERGALDWAGEYALEALNAPCAVAIVTDANVAPLLLDRVTRSLEDSGFSVVPVVVPAGESSKSIERLGMLLESFAEAGLTRSDAVVALGGGVIGDLAGFTAGCYLRGVRFVQVPTTLLAAVDSSVGGKTAVDLDAGKNLAGMFVQPEVVICDSDVIEALPPHVFADGMAEVIKTAVLDGEELFSLTESADTAIEEIIAACVSYKARIVESDEKEEGDRQLLNLGHTVGHAIERSSGYTIMHGHAVAAGLAIIARAADELGLSEAPVAPRVIAALEAHGLPTGTEFTAQELAEAATTDKKRRGNSITLVIPRAIGRCTLEPTPLAELEGIIAAGIGKGH